MAPDAYFTMRLTYVLFTLYMLVVMVRWFGPWLELDLHAKRLRWIPAIVDPVLRKIRALLPPLGPVDYAPIALLLGLWLLRTIAIRMLLTLAARSAS